MPPTSRVSLNQETFDGIPYPVWKDIQEQVQRAVFVGRGIHTDELKSYDSFFPVMMDMFRQLRPQYDDPASGKRYVMIFSNYQFIRPCHPKHGPIHPIHGILLGYYEELVYADVWYEVYGKQPLTAAEPQENKEPSDQPDQPTNHDVEMAEPLEAGIASLLADMDRQIDPDRDMADEKADEKTDEKIDEKEEKEEPLSAQLPGFRVDRDDANPYPYLHFKSPVVSDMLVCRIPAYVLSAMCQMSTPFPHPEAYFKPSNIGCTFPVSHIHKICPGVEQHAFNIYLDDSRKGMIEARLTFVDPEKQGRTNSTLKFSLYEPALNGKRPSAKDESQKASSEDTEEDGKSNSKFKKMSMNGVPRFRMEIPHETPKVHVPIAVFCMAYGWTMSDILATVKRYISRPITPAIQWYLDAIAYHTDGCHNQVEAIQRVGRCFTKCRKDSSGTLTAETIASFVSHTLMAEFYPNLNTRNPDIDNVRKGLELCRVMAALIVQTDLVNNELPEHLRWRPQDSRSYVDKRLHMPGEQLVTFFRMAFKEAAGKVAVGIRRAVREGRAISIQSLFDPNMIKISKGIRNGVFDVKKMTEATQANQRRTQAAVTGFGLKNIHMQVSSIRKFVQGRYMYDPTPILTHPTQRNRVDPYVTPESENCGITRYKCPECWVTGYVDMTKMNSLLVDIITQHANEYGWIPVATMSFAAIATTTTLVPPNMDALTIVYDSLGGVCGWVSDHLSLYKRLVSYRRAGVYPGHITFSSDPVRRLFFIHADAGRMLSPVLIRSELPRLSANLPRLSTLRDPMIWLLDNGYVEYVCPAEEYRSSSFDPSQLLVLVAPRLEDAVQDPRYTHVAVHAGNMFSLTANSTYVNMNQGPRIMHSANNGKRAMPYQWAPWDSGTHEAYQLATHPERPLVSSPYDVTKLFPSNCEPSDQHVLVAMLTHASNIEDAVVVRKGLIDRGFGTSVEQGIIVCKSSQDIQFRRPSNDVRGVSALARYAALDDNGIPRIGAVLRGEDAIVGRVLQYQDSITGEPRLRDVSHYLPVSTYTYRVAHIEWMEDKSGSILQVYVQKIHRPEKGDKFYFPFGQKFTVGRIVEDAEMCFLGHGGPLAGTEIGMLLNPLSLSRATVGMCASLMSITARLIDPSSIDPYDTVFLTGQELQCDLQTCRDILMKAGFSANARTPIYNGITGRLMGHCVVGYLPVRTLKHIAKTKMRARSHEGKVDQLTRQPVPGQKDNGGLRQGEMERINIGPSCGMSETAFDSKHVIVFWCVKCQIQAIGHVATKTAICQGCGSREFIRLLHQSYVGVLVGNELEAAGFGILPMVEKMQEVIVRV